MPENYIAMFNAPGEEESRAIEGFYKFYVKATAHAHLMRYFQEREQTR